jgi:hypothetical protein
MAVIGMNEPEEKRGVVSLFSQVSSNVSLPAVPAIYIKWKSPGSARGLLKFEVAS